MIPRLVLDHIHLLVLEPLAYLARLAQLVNQAHPVLMDTKVPLVSLDKLALLDLQDPQDY